MKKIVIIILIFQLISCSDNVKPGLYIDYIKRYNELSSFMLTKKNEKLHYFSLLAKKHPIEKVFINKLNKVDKMSFLVFQKVQKIKNKISGQDNIGSKELESLKNKNYLLDTKTVDNIKSDVNKISTAFLNFNGMAKYKNDIDSTYSIDKWSKIPTLSGQECSSLESLAVISKIQYDILNAELKMISLLLSNISVEEFRLNKIDVVVKANEKFVKKGDYYKAEIFLSAVDTAFTPEFIIENKIIKSRKVKYRKKVTSSIGEVIQKCKLKYRNEMSGNTNEIQFEIKYNVIK